MQLYTYLNFRGNCEEAFKFYEQHLGGKIFSVTRHSEMQNPNLPADWGNKIVHARMEIGSTVLLGADIPTAEPMRSAYLTLLLDSDEEAEKVYAILSADGQVYMKMAQTPFASRFAMLRDRFGTLWMLMHENQHQ
jgi:PhnB protein